MFFTSTEVLKAIVIKGAFAVCLFLFIFLQFNVHIVPVTCQISTNGYDNLST